MNAFEMVIGIVLIVAIASVLRARLVVGHRRHGARHAAAGTPDETETRRLHDEVRTLKERIQVLERVITDTHSASSLDREIDKLRSEPK